MIGFATDPFGRFSVFLLIFIILRPFSFSPKKKDQKERRRSARGRFFRESPHGHK